MCTNTSKPDGEPRDALREMGIIHRDSSEWLALFEREVHDALGIDAAEFVRRSRAGAYEDFDPDPLTLSVSIPMYDAIAGGGGGRGRDEEAPLVAHLLPVVRAIGAIVPEPSVVTVSPKRIMPTIRVAELRSPQWAPMSLRSGDPDAQWWLRFRSSVLIAPRHGGSEVEIALKADTWQLFRSTKAMPQSQSPEDVVVRHSGMPDGVERQLWPHLHGSSSVLDRDPVLQLALGSLDATTARNFVRMAIEDYGIEPVVADWRERLAVDGTPD